MEKHAFDRLGGAIAPCPPPWIRHCYTYRKIRSLKNIHRPTLNKAKFTRITNRLTTESCKVFGDERILFYDRCSDVYEQVSC